MSDIWTQECKECQGSGYKGDCKGCSVVNKRTKGEHCDDHCHCPPCSGSGGFNLGVKCQCDAEDICPRKSEFEADKGDSIHIKGHYCDGNVTRPLTVDEVVKLPRLPKLDLIAGRIDVMYDKQGQPVKLMPREG